MHHLLNCYPKMSIYCNFLRSFAQTSFNDQSLGLSICSANLQGSDVSNNQRIKHVNKAAVMEQFRLMSPFYILRLNGSTERKYRCLKALFCLLNLYPRSKGGAWKQMDSGTNIFLPTTRRVFKISHSLGNCTF